MTHSFKLGSHYQNREGEYQVIDVHGDEMTIRYTSGKSIRTDISTQQRILDNLEIENDMQSPHFHCRAQTHAAGCNGSAWAVIDSWPSALR